MEIKFVNNSVSGVNRRYRGFNFELPGSAEITIDVPSQYVADLKKYLKNRHPAVSVIDVAEETAAESAGAQTWGGVTETEETTDSAASATEGSEEVAAGEVTAEETAAESAGKKNNKKSGGKK